MSFLVAAQAGASIVQGIGAMRAGEANRDAAYGAAREERIAATANESRVRVDARRAIGKQMAAQAASGFQPGTGTALDALRESQIEAALDVLEIRRQGAGRSRALQVQGDNARSEGRYAMLSSLIGAGAGLAKSKSDWAQARSGSTPYNPNTPGFGGPIINTSSGRGVI